LRRVVLKSYLFWSDWGSCWGLTVYSKMKEYVLDRRALAEESRPGLPERWFEGWVLLLGKSSGKRTLEPYLRKCQREFVDV